MDMSQDWLDAQCGVLGSALIEPKLVPLVLTRTEESDYSGLNRRIYLAMRMLFSDGKPADPVTIHAQLGGDKSISEHLMQLMEITPTAAHIEHYISACREQARIASIKDIAQQISDSALYADIKALMEKANRLTCDKTNLRIVTMDTALKSFYERHDAGEKPAYLQWPISALNEHIYAERGDFVLIGGYPSAGKSAFSLQCAWAWAEEKRVGFFSFETSAEKLFDRQIAHLASVPLKRVKKNSLTAEDWDNITAKGVAISKRNLELIPAVGMTVSDIQAISTARRYEVVIIDYLQLISARGKDGYERVTNISMDLHRFSQSSGCYVVGLSQLSRQTKNAGTTVQPTMSSLRESGQLEQDADLILLLYLDKPQGGSSQRVLSCAKNKEGEQFRTLLDFDGATQTFSKAPDFRGIQSQLRNMGRQKRQQETQLRMLPPDTAIPAEFEEE